MNRRVVLDASAAVALLADASGHGAWAGVTLKGCAAFAPHLMPFEVDSVLRRRLLAGRLDRTAAALARTALRRMGVSLWPHASLGGRSWELRDTVSSYDACYVALAELLDAPLVTLDRRLAQAPGPRCGFLVPPG